MVLAITAEPVKKGTAIKIITDVQINVLVVSPNMTDPSHHSTLSAQIVIEHSGTMSVKLPTREKRVRQKCLSVNCSRGVQNVEYQDLAPATHVERFANIAMQNILTSKHISVTWQLRR